MVKCSECNTELEENAKFCPDCGEILVEKGNKIKCSNTECSYEKEVKN